MKRLLIIAFGFISLYGKGQISTLQVQAKRGVFTERLNINGQWIDRISTDLNTPDSANDNVLATGKAIADFLRPRTSGYIKNQFLAPQPASVWIQGRAVTGSVPEYLPLLSAGMPAQVNVTYGDREQGASVQRSSNDQAPASVVFFKNNSSDINTLNALQPGDTLGSLSFSAHTGDLSAVNNVMDIHGLVEKIAPTYLSSGFVFNTTDTAGNYGQRMWLNANGNLLLGNGTTNPYRLNVAAGDVRINSLAVPSYYGNLVSANNDGVLTPLPNGGTLWADDSGRINAEVGPPENPRVYTALLSQTGQNDPVAHVLQNTHQVQINWTRSAPGVYFGKLVAGNFGGPRFLYAEASDEAGNVFSAQLLFHRYVSEEDPDYFMLVVKDNSLANMDGFTNLSIQIINNLDF
ncbi:hypothetical protein A4H97_32200 [Niastella yeongjuensis]|uniref:Uncharacterized protein n=1 Tax=Niastella yeongjuensis TaxID=354355 RepID=A0A1V9EJ37_9BACT|nr:hypothetical protein [Niastella yeongjuensis]OQP45905.1 hypothetical protein A4H97_32200 [Niastella yeongjuensis]SEP46855.1 hypothetical protein SAMN05660816_06522 [Niastella yeongjuensis]